MSMLFLVHCIDWNDVGVFCIIYSVCLFFVCRADVISEFMLFHVGDCCCWDVRSGVILCVASISFHTFMFAGQFYWQMAVWLAGFYGKFRCFL